MKSSLHIGHISLDPLLEQKLLVDVLPNYDVLHNGSIVGNYSHRVTGIDAEDWWLSSQYGIIENTSEFRAEWPMRVIRNRNTVTLPNTKIRDTETAFTRCFLKSLKPRKVRREQREARATTRPPQYCNPFDSDEDMFYVDIRAAYQSIYERLSWRVEYLRGKYFSMDDDKLIYPFPSEWKSGRSYVVTGCLPRVVHFIYEHKVVVKPAFNQFENPPLVHAVWDVLASIARFAIEVYHARYFNLDGAVVPYSQLDNYNGFLDALGLRHRVKQHGVTRIRNLASWQIGETKTKRFTVDPVSVFTDAVPVSLSEAEWILTRFVRM